MKKLLFLILLGLVAYFVWPTRYALYAPGEGPFAAEVDAPTRIDRLSGNAWVMTRTGTWQPIETARNTNTGAFERPAVDPNATRRPSALHNQQVRDQQLRSVENTQAAVDAATQQNP